MFPNGGQTGKAKKGKENQRKAKERGKAGKEDGGLGRRSQGARLSAGVRSASDQSTLRWVRRHDYPRTGAEVSIDGANSVDAGTSLVGSYPFEESVRAARPSSKAEWLLELSKVSNVAEMGCKLAWGYL